MQISLSRYIYDIRILRDIHVGLYTYNIPLSSPRLGAEAAAQGDPEPQRLPEVPIARRRGWYGEGRFHSLSKVGYTLEDKHGTYKSPI